MAVTDSAGVSPAVKFPQLVCLFGKGYVALLLFSLVGRKSSQDASTLTIFQTEA
jgi:hypothetical protein